MANAHIINNSLSADESKLRLHNPILYTADPETGKPVKGAQWYIGLPGRDPVANGANKKIVYALQEDGSAIPLQQPVLCGAGGIPMYNGSPVGLATSGSYSLKILDSNGGQVYYFPQVDGFDFQGFSGVIAEEAQTVTGGNQTLVYKKIEATTASFYISQDDLGVEFKGSYLRPGVDYTIVNSTTITMLQSTPNGTVILGRQSDPTGQIVPVSEGSSALFVFTDIAAAKDSNLQVGDAATINGGTSQNDGLGGNRYITVPNGTGTADDENYINLNNGNQLEAVKNNFKLSRYAEVTTEATSVSTVLTLDLNNGNVFKTTLFENLSDISFTNLNPDNTMTTTVSLKITQDAASARTITWPDNVNWSGGTAPTMTATLSAYDRYIFVTDDGGTTWDGSVVGQDFS